MAPRILECACKARDKNMFKKSENKEKNCLIFYPSFSAKFGVCGSKMVDMSTFVLV